MDIFDEITEATLADCSALREEMEIVYRELVLPGWGTPVRHGFPRTLYGFVMNSFALLDRLSLYREGGARTVSGGQTGRMCRFLINYVDAESHVAAVTVKLWRHTLMHSGSPQVILDQATQRRVKWLLHWKEHLPREQHMTIIQDAAEDVLNFGAIYIAENVQSAAERFFADISKDQAQRSVIEENHRRMLAEAKL